MENNKNLNEEKSSFFEEKVSSSNSLEPQLRFREFKNNWHKEQLGNSCNVQMCKRIFAHQTSSSGEIPFFKIGTIGSNPDAYISRELFEEYKEKYKYPKNNEVMITCAGTVGRCWQYDGTPSYYQDSNIVWIDNPKQIILNNFLYRLLDKTDWNKLNSTTITRIYNDNLRNLVCCYPQKEEQEKIAKFLSLIDARIEKQRLLVENLKKYKRGLLFNIFNNIEDTVKLEQITSYHSSNLTLESANTKGEFALYDANGICSYINTYMHDKDYVAIVKDGSGVGRLQYCTQKSSHIGTLGSLKTNNCSPYYLYTVLQYIDFTKYITGMAIPHIYYKDYKNFNIPYPKQNIQNQIENIFKNIDKIMEKSVLKLEKLYLLKKGLLQQMFI